MSINRALLGSKISIAIIGSVTVEELSYLKAVLPAVMHSLGYRTKSQKLTYPGRKRNSLRPTVMVFEYTVPEFISPPDALNEVRDQCRIAKAGPNYKSPINSRTSAASLFEKIVGQKVWAPRTKTELEDAVTIISNLRKHTTS